MAIEKLNAKNFFELNAKLGLYELGFSSRHTCPNTGTHKSNMLEGILSIEKLNAKNFFELNAKLGRADIHVLTRAHTNPMCYFHSLRPRAKESILAPHSYTFELSKHITRKKVRCR